MEIWKDIIGYEGYYQISNLGNVKNIQTNKILIGDTNNLGYRRVTLYTPIKKRFFVHRLVALHFCEGANDELVVNHIDGNKANNLPSNLEEVTISRNTKHAYENNLAKAKKGSDNTQSKLTQKDVEKIFELRRVMPSICTSKYGAERDSDSWK